VGRTDTNQADQGGLAARKHKMRTVLWLLVGLAIVVLAWIPLNLSDPRDIPFIPAILGIVGSVVGGVIALVAVVRWVRRGAATTP
jgi:hypothetical protein